MNFRDISVMSPDYCDTDLDDLYVTLVKDFMNTTVDEMSSSDTKTTSLSQSTSHPKSDAIGSTTVSGATEEQVIMVETDTLNSMSFTPLTPSPSCSGDVDFPSPPASSVPSSLLASPESMTSSDIESPSGKNTSPILSPNTSKSVLTSPVVSPKATSRLIDSDIQSPTSKPASPGPMLPPCRVCGEAASGFHYGVNTCEACKGFFRRSIQRDKDYRCSTGKETCEIKPGKRSICPKCRFRKCLHVGMSKGAIKTGRYTHQKKTQNIQEVKKLQELQKSALPLNKFNNKTTCSNIATTSPSLVTSRSSSTKHSSSKNSPASAEHINEFKSDEVMEQNILQFTQLTKACETQTEEFMRSIPALQAKFIEKQRLQEEVFGTMKVLSYEDYRQIYKATGIDIDGRREQLVSCSNMVEECVKKLIAFAKCVPGFRELPIEDQIGLIKCSRFEVLFIASHRAYNIEHKIVTIPDGTTFNENDILKFYEKELADGLFRLAGRLQDMKLTWEETSVLKAVPLFFTDRCTLESPEQVEAIQRRTLNMLEYLYSKNHPDNKWLLTKTLLWLTDVRNLTEMYIKSVEKVMVDWNNDVQFPPLAYELL